MATPVGAQDEDAARQVREGAVSGRVGAEAPVDRRDPPSSQFRRWAEALQGA